MNIWLARICNRWSYLTIDFLHVVHANIRVPTGLVGHLRRDTGIDSAGRHSNRKEIVTLLLQGWAVNLARQPLSEGGLPFNGNKSKSRFKLASVLTFTVSWRNFNIWRFLLIASACHWKRCGPRAANCPPPVLVYEKSRKRRLKKQQKM